MANIDQELKDIMNAVYGRDVRQSIHDGIKAVNESAEGSASSAQAFATQSGTYATNAKESETKAKTSETNAKDSETKAKTSENNSKTSETNAKTSETNAKASETSASASATSASASATSASDSVTSASTYATNSENSAINSKASEDNAKESEENAKAYELSAKGYSEIAYTYEQNALAYKNAAEIAQRKAEEAEQSAQQIVGIGIATTSFAGLVKPDGDTISVEADGTIKVNEENLDLYDTVEEVKGDIDDLETDINVTNTNASIRNSVGTSLSLDTSKGGVRLNKVYGNSYKSKNLFGTSAWVNTDLYSAQATGKPTIINSNSLSVKNNLGVNRTDGFYYPSTVIGKEITVSFNYTQPCNVQEVTVGVNVTQHKFMNASGGFASFTITPTTTDTFLSFNNDTSITDGSTNTFTNIQVELGSTATDFEPYGITSVGDMGWFDGELLRGYYNSTSNGVYTSTTTDTCSANKINCKPNDVIVLSKNISSGLFRVLFFDENNTYLGIQAQTTSGNYTVTAPSNATYFKVNINSAIPLDSTLKITINGKSACVVKEHGKNLIKDYTVGYWWNAGNTLVANANQVCGKIPCKPSTSYALSSEITTHYYYFVFLDKNGDYIKKASSSTGEIGFIYTTPSDCYYLCWSVYINSATKEKFENLKVWIEENDKFTSYIPYSNANIPIPLNDNLRSVNNVKDYIDEDGEHHLIGSFNIDDYSWTVRTGETFWICTGAIKSICGDMTTSAEYIENIITNSGVTKLLASYTGSYMRLYTDDLVNTPSGIIYYPKLESTVTPLTTEQLKAIHSLKAYEDKTYIDTADVYAKATLDVDYSKVQSEAIENENNIAIANRVHEDDVAQNLLPIKADNSTFSGNSITLVTSKNKVTVSGTATASKWIWLNGYFCNENIANGEVIKVANDGVYTLSGSGSKAKLHLYDVTTSTQLLNDDGSATLYSSHEYKVAINYDNGVTYAETLYPMIEKGTVAHSYKPYKDCYVTNDKFKDLESNFRVGVNQIITSINTTSGASEGDDNYLDGSSTPTEISNVISSFSNIGGGLELLYENIQGKTDIYEFNINSNEYPYVLIEFVREDISTTPYETQKNNNYIRMAMIQSGQTDYEVLLYYLSGSRYYFEKIISYTNNVLTIGKTLRNQSAWTGSIIGQPYRIFGYKKSDL